MDTLLAIVLLATFVLAFGIVLLYLVSLVGPKREVNPVKMMPYECGVPGIESKDSKISVKFYLTAILFILFDIEIIFMYPWALTFGDFNSAGYGLYLFLVMMVFIALFVFGLFWEIKSKALEWE